MNQYELIALIAKKVEELNALVAQLRNQSAPSGTPVITTAVGDPPPDPPLTN